MGKNCFMAGTLAEFMWITYFFYIFFFLFFAVKDNLVTLNTMLTSPHVADLKPLVETWIGCLQEIENITDIWTDCQKKVTQS